MNKKEEIRLLKLQLKECKGKLHLAETVLEPIKKQSSQRGARMQIMHKFMKETTRVPMFIELYFDKDGVPLL